MSIKPTIYTKTALIEKLQAIAEMGWIQNARHGNQGGIGNTLEDLLGIEENNLPIPNAAEWELKTQRLKTSSHTTLFHMEPSPRGLKFVPNIFLPKYGWKHQKAGIGYPENEMSSREVLCLWPDEKRYQVVLPVIERRFWWVFSCNVYA